MELMKEFKRGATISVVTGKGGMGIGCETCHATDDVRVMDLFGQQLD